MTRVLADADAAGFTIDDVLTLRSEEQQSLFRFRQLLKRHHIHRAKTFKPRSQLLNPHVTSIELSGRALAATPATLKIRNNRFFQGSEIGTIELPAGGQTGEIAVPASSFAAGINELIFITDAPVSLQTLRFRDAGLKKP